MTSPAASKPQRGHVLPRAPQIDIRTPGRLRTAHVLAILSISHSTLYNRLRGGTVPPPDGRDGGQNFWRTETILDHIHASSETVQEDGTYE
jgi:predicted DNA-binding transcriptional regulator AlpA